MEVSIGTKNYSIDEAQANQRLAKDSAYQELLGKIREFALPAVEIDGYSSAMYTTLVLIASGCSQMRKEGNDYYRVTNGEASVLFDCSSPNQLNVEDILQTDTDTFSTHVVVAKSYDDQGVIVEANFNHSNGNKQQFRVEYDSDGHSKFASFRESDIQNVEKRSLFLQRNGDTVMYSDRVLRESGSYQGDVSDFNSIAQIQDITNYLKIYSDPIEYQHYAVSPNTLLEIQKNVNNTSRAK